VTAIEGQSAGETARGLESAYYLPGIPKAGQRGQEYQEIKDRSLLHIGHIFMLAVTVNSSKKNFKYN
jgi:hypothetical protein